MIGGEALHGQDNVVASFVQTAMGYVGHDEIVDDLAVFKRKRSDIGVLMLRLMRTAFRHGNRCTPGPANAVNEKPTSSADSIVDMKTTDRLNLRLVIMPASAP